MVVKSLTIPIVLIITNFIFIDFSAETSTFERKSSNVLNRCQTLLVLLRPYSLLMVVLLNGDVKDYVLRSQLTTVVQCIDYLYVMLV